VTSTVNARFAVSLTVSLCLALTLTLNIVSQFDPTVGNRRVHVGIEVAAAMVLIFIAAVLLGRFRLNRSRRTLLKLGAVVVLVLDNLFSAILTASVNSVAGGFGTWAFAGNGFLGAALLATAAVLPDRPVRQPRSALLAVISASVGVVTLNIVTAAVLRDVLPGAFAVPPTSGDDLRLLSENWTLIGAEVVTAGCYGIAAVAFARLAEHEHDEFLEWLAIGSVIAAVAFVNYAMFPSQFTELVYSGDVFFLAAVAALAIGAVREISREEAAQIRSAVLEERRRVARDLHDGVAQELAFIASQAQWIMRNPDERGALGHILDAVERALDETRGAITALSRPMDEPLDVALGNAARDVADRVGARLRLDLERGVEVPPEWREALLRIAREAVANAVRHGHARSVSLELRNGDAIWLRVTDNGGGFDPQAPRSSQSFGLTSMRERTESLGGSFEILSSPGSGTQIEVTLP
jgi:signal transduction histidine kinase